MNTSAIKNLNISLIQQVITPNDPELNLQCFGAAIKQLPATDLIILPEVFTTGFCSSARSYAEQVDGRAYSCLACW